MKFSIIRQPQFLNTIIELKCSRPTSKEQLSNEIHPMHAKTQFLLPLHNCHIVRKGNIQMPEKAKCIKLQKYSVHFLSVCAFITRF